tara:strand:- start:182 stop:2410 length:2229 start_codon:yes stop_codon:yes gene_type:complete
MIKRFFYITLTTFLISNPDEYIWPTDASKTLTAFFGEMRPHRYHVGIDVRTYGENGKEIYAITDGYIYRVKVSNDGYGNVIYIKHNDGNISLYAHLSKFNKKIQKVVEQLQFKRNSYSIDHLLEPGLINVSKGDIIGYTGDTGGLSGPHLHFEIRDEINRPINPLNTSLGGEFNDTKKPQPISIAFIPQSNESKINGFNLTEEYLINQDQTIIDDTLKVEGEFGIAINVVDKVDGQPFSYGIYSIDLFINDEYHYGVKFDRTSFNQSNQIYLERNYELLSLNHGEYYQLYKTDFQNNSFINKNSKGSIKNLEGINEFKIIIKDINQNETELIGNFIYEDLIHPEFEAYSLVDGGWIINYSNINTIIDFECSISNSKNIESETIECLKSYSESSPYVNIVNDTSLIVRNTNKTYNTIKLKLKTLNNETVEHFVLLSNDLKDIKGDIFINHNYQNIGINYIEDDFSGLTPNLVFRKDGDLHKKPLSRKNKNIVSSELFNIDEFLTMDEISIEYEVDNYNVSKKTDIEKMAVFPNIFADKNFKNGQISIAHQKETFFDNAIIYTYSLNSTDQKSIIQPFYIGPNAIPFNKPIQVSVNLFNNDDIIHSNICIYKNNKWIPLATNRDNTKTISAEFKGGNKVGVVIDKTKPNIEAIVPRNKATYKLNNIDDFEIFLRDDFSGINYKDGIILKINGKEVLVGYNTYQKKLIPLSVQDYFKIGKNTYELSVWDNSNNKRDLKGYFFIKE